jgi:hypothetical protein
MAQVVELCLAKKKRKKKECLVTKSESISVAVCGKWTIDLNICHPKIYSFGLFQDRNKF